MITTAGMTLIGSATPAAAAGITWYVDAASGVVDDCGTTAGEACATITEVVGLAGTDDILSVAPGNYSEVVRLDKSLTVTGSGDGVVLDVPNGQDGPALTIADGAAVTVSTMTIRSGLDGNAALQIEGGSTGTLSEVTINGSPDDGADPSPGITVTGGSTATINGGAVSGNGTSGLLVRGGSTVTITGTTFADNGFIGVQLGEPGDEDAGPTSTLTITDSQISGSGMGLYVFAGNATVSGGSVNGNQFAGVATESADALVDITGTSFVGNGSAAAGDFTGAILLRQNGTVTATGVSITENYAGAMVAGGSLTVVDSKVTDNVGDPDDGSTQANGVGIAGIAGTITVGDEDPVPVEITVTGTEVSRNITGMTLISATAEVTDSTIADNPNSGILASNDDDVPTDGELVLTGSTVSGNALEPNIGTVGSAGLRLEDGAATVTATTFSGNRVGLLGVTGAVTVNGGSFSENTDVGVMAVQATVDLADLAIIGNGLTESASGPLVGGIVSQGAVTGRNVEVARNSVGIYVVEGTFALSDSVVRDSVRDPDRAESGTGIAAHLIDGGGRPARVTIDATEIAGNTVGVEVANATIMIDATTIVANSDAGVAVYGSGGVEDESVGLVATASTVADNGASPVNSGPNAPIGGLWLANAGRALVGGSILQAAEGEPTCAFDSNSPGILFDGGYNVVSDDSCGGIDRDTSLGGVDPKLEPLADNGSENGTRTMLPGDGSPAIDLIVPDTALMIPPEMAAIDAQNLCAAGAVDQNGMTRPLGGGCDAGAAEAPAAVVQALHILTESLPQATTGVPYNAAFAANGGNGGPYTWAIVDGELPPGLEFHPATGNIDGTPVERGDTTITVQVSEPDVPAPTPTSVGPSTTGGPSTTVVPPTTGGPSITGGPSNAGSPLRIGAPAVRVALAAAPDPVTKEFTISVVAPAVPTVPTTAPPTTAAPTTASVTATTAVTTTASETPSETATATATTTTQPSTVRPSTSATVVSSSASPAAPPSADPGDLATTGLDVGSGLAGGLLILLLGVGLYFFGRPRQRGSHEG